MQTMLEFIVGYSAGQRSAGRAASLARSAAVADGTLHSNRIEDLNERIDQLALVVRGIWALIEESGVTPERLMAKIEELDMADGVADGKIGRSPVVCPSCDSRVAAGLRRCQFCGSEVEVTDSHPLGNI